jgi:hypothetical protein
MTQQLSPAAQAVWEAFGTYPLRADHIDEDLVPALAAALRALAVRIKGADNIRQDVLDIADELEGAS